MVVNKIESTTMAKTMEEILKIAKLKNKIKELELKRALNLEEQESYAERKEKEIDGLERELRKSNQEKEFMRYTTKQRNDEHHQFMSNAYDQTFTQNIQLSDWLNTTTSNLHEKRREVRAAKQQFEDCLLYTSPSPRDKRQSRMPSSA